MNSNCDVCQFLSNKPLQNQILTTEYWTVGIIPDQPYLGRALVTSLVHRNSLAELTDDEWRDFQEIERKLEPAYKKAFGATPLNMGCFMNHGFRDDPPHPHVHWQIFPRYKESVEFAGLSWEDTLYGSFYDDNATRPVDDNVIKQIADKLKANL